MHVKFWDYRPEYEAQKREILAAVQGVFESGHLVLGERVKRFEADFAGYVGARYGIGVNSATDALFLTLKAFGIGAGDEVMTVANTAIPTVSAITATGATVRFVEIDPATMLMDVTRLETVASKRTKAIIPVHLYGQMVDMRPLLAFAERRNISVIEDCAQAHGARQNGCTAGTLSRASCFSFYPTKNLGAFGDAGMILTDDSDLADKLRRMRFYGISAQYYSIEQGYNSRLDEVQAAILSVRLERLEHCLDVRRSLARFYDERLNGALVQTPVTLEGNVHSYHLYVCHHPKRDLILEQMKARGVDLAVHYPHPVHLMPGFAQLGYARGALPITERASAEVFSLPLYPGLSADAQEFICDQLREVLEAMSV